MQNAGAKLATMNDICTRRPALALAALLLLSTPMFGAAKKPNDSYHKITSPEVAARRLYEAWKKHDRKEAKVVATNEAVLKLFETNFRPMKLKGCEHVDEGFQCIYHDAVEDLFDISFNVEGGTSAGYNVTSVSFSSEE